MNKNTKRIAHSAMIAAMYFALGIVFAPLSFLSVQVRFAEALTLLPLITPNAIWGVAVGCVLTNIYGLSIGATILGAVDIVVGSLATLVAAILTYKLRNKTYKGLPLMAGIPPVLINAVVIGSELAIAIHGTIIHPMALLYMLQVGVGQFISCFLIGIPMILFLKRSKIDQILK